MQASERVGRAWNWNLLLKGDLFLTSRSNPPELGRVLRSPKRFRATSLTFAKKFEQDKSPSKSSPEISDLGSSITPTARHQKRPSLLLTQAPTREAATTCTSWEVKVPQQESVTLD